MYYFLPCCLPFGSSHSFNKRVSSSCVIPSMQAIDPKLVNHVRMLLAQTRVTEEQPETPQMTETVMGIEETLLYATQKKILLAYIFIIVYNYINILFLYTY